MYSVQFRALKYMYMYDQDLLIAHVSLASRK